MKQLPSSIFSLLYHAKRACSFLHRYLTCLQLQQKGLLILPHTPHPPLHPLGTRTTMNAVPRGTRKVQAVPCLVLGQVSPEPPDEKVAGNPSMQHRSSAGEF